ncbi:hypothetical protein ABIS04_13250 [Shewanella sp. H8]|uniref:hypothetical protein n=1 Tax=Shewanella sp. H8 TaxID=3342676 RepID=UPI0033152417
MREITKNQFNAYCYARQPLVITISNEIKWYEAGDRKVLATLLLDNTDKDYNFVILVRDARKLFRAWDISWSHPTIEDAEEKLVQKMNSLVNDGNDYYEQGDETSPPHDILAPKVDEDKQHEYFRVLVTEKRMEAARNLIVEAVYSYVDVDGNYIKEFQTHGFDARLWELFLYIFLYDSGFEFNQDYNAPDYLVSFFGKQFCIEAVTVNPSQNSERPDPPSPQNDVDMQKLCDDYMPIKFGSSLFTKLQKKYWEKPHVQGKPLIIAIHDYHMPGSMTWSRNALVEYLYGKRAIVVEIDGKRSIYEETIETHSWQGKTIPSNFFNSENAENISAVLFTNTATITKFNRMGKLAGLGGENIKMQRVGVKLHSDPKSLGPVPFAIDVDDPSYEESWSESVVMYHNPNALHPVDINCFSTINHLWLDKESGELVGIQREGDIINSITNVFEFET